MNTLNIQNLYQNLQKTIQLNSSSIISLLSQAQRKIKLFKKEEPSLSILYPARSTVSESFFAPIRQLTQQTLSIETIKRQSHAGPLCPHYVAPREPIVLCHGLFGFDIQGPEFFPVLQRHYWDGIEDSLARLGAKVIVTKVPQAGSISERSQALHHILTTVLVGKKLNFVAHSMGGLDCRHLLANNPKRAYNVQSLTTICTPHRGSPVMDWFRDHIGLGCDPLTRQQKKWIIDYFDTPAYSHLTTDFCNHYFNPNTPDDSTVQYYSYGASTQFSDASLLNFPGRLVYEKEGENDGIVSVKSAQWGTYVKTVQADHWDLSGKSCFPYRLSKLKNNQDFDRIGFYAELATHLYNQGH
ncbi:hypothetical protein CU098_001457 [Rhizopus stolonifer]|uniref:AB hydrolase-1 domain-containing protein n=1 Tax=Rhizopus stolonifer TaxID=4846 RepID=A0A367KF78_RHIST|nr:hypothetical protein CU098_001457 [Rhizopus stolonifer]